MHEQKQKWKFGTNFGCIFGLLQIYPTYKNLAPIFLEYKEREGKDESLPHLQEASLHLKVN